MALHPFRQPNRHVWSGFVLEITVLVIGLLIFILALVMMFAFASKNRQLDGENVAGSDVSGGSSSLSSCQSIPEEWLSHINEAASRSGADPALVAAIFAAGEHRYYQGGKWPSFVESPPYPSELNPAIHDNGPNGYVRGPGQFKEETFASSIENIYPNAGASRFGRGFKVEPYIEQVTPSLAAAGVYLKRMGGVSGASDTNIKRAIYGYYNGETKLRNEYNENHEYVRKVFPAYQDYSDCRSGDTSESESRIVAHGTYAPILDPSILRRFIPVRPHHGRGTLAPDPATPAMDIAVEIGTKSYAFTNGKIVTVYRGNRTFRPGTSGSQSGSCGNGFNMRGDDGQAYLYCHFDKLAPEIIIGGRLQAGQFVGLTGNTGRSTGPHLHFGLLGPRSIERADALRSKVSDTVN